MKKTLLFLLFIVITSCYQETAIAIEGDFATSYANEDESIPVIIKIDNKITGVAVSSAKRMAKSFCS